MRDDHSAWLRWLDAVRLDVVGGARFLRANRAFTGVAVLVLALGIGVNAALFGAVYAAILRPLPYPEASRLVEIRTRRIGAQPIESRFLAIPAVEDIASQGGAFEHVGYSIETAFAVTGIAEPESVRGLEVGGEFFSAYGVNPALGRYVLPADTVPGHEQVVVLSHALWQRSFGGDPSVVGRTIDLAPQPLTLVAPWVPPSRSFTVIGVMPRAERFPVAGALWTPLRRGAYSPRMGVSPRAAHNVAVVARLTRDVTIARANQDLHTIAARLGAAYPETDREWELWAVSLLYAVTEHHRDALFLFLGAVSVVLLLTCVSVSSLLLAKSRARQKDVAIRSTLGATRARLVQQRVCEALILSSIGGLLAVTVAIAGVGVLRAYAPPGTPNLDRIGVDWLLLAYALGLSALAGLMLGLVPAVQTTTRDLTTALKDVGGTGTRASSWLLPVTPRGVLIALQIALAFPLVVGSVLTLRSLDKLLHVDLGFRRDHVLSMQIKPIAARCAAFNACIANIAEMLDRVRAVPGVRSAAVAGTRPLSPGPMMRILVEGESDASTSDTVGNRFQLVTPEYFRTLGIPIRAGRTFANSDTSTAPFVAVINQTLADRRFGGHAVGKRLSFAPSGRLGWIEVVGTVADVRDVSLTRSPEPTIYLAMAQANMIPALHVLVRTDADPMSVAAPIRHEIRRVDKDATIADLITLDQVRADAVAAPGFQTSLLGILAGLALSVALLGIHGIIAHVVSGRVHEFGVRLALGAQPRDVIFLVLRDGLPALATGIVLGMLSAFALTRFLRHWLFEIQPTDVATFAGVALLMTAVGLFASYVPARRATRIDPLTVLRGE